jgi:hypothetical protein
MRALILLDEVRCMSVIVKCAGIVLLDPDADELTGNIVTLGSPAYSIAAKVFLNDLAPELQTVGLMSHWLSPKAKPMVNYNGPTCPAPRAHSSPNAPTSMAVHLL